MASCSELVIMYIPQHSPLPCACGDHSGISRGGSKPLECNNGHEFMYIVFFSRMQAIADPPVLLYTCSHAVEPPPVLIQPYYPLQFNLQLTNFLNWLQLQRLCLQMWHAADQPHMQLLCELRCPTSSCTNLVNLQQSCHDNGSKYHALNWEFQCSVQIKFNMHPQLATDHRIQHAVFMYNNVNIFCKQYTNSHALTLVYRYPLHAVSIHMHDTCCN